ncbi:MAG: hypothetical protein MJK18_13230, partial [Bdellovibrionales bacterium]|nr:hypothetical protein [Bdellovibrionales bacterium]
AHIINDILKKAKKCKSVVWTQEEPKNMGAWSYIYHPLKESIQASGLDKLDVEYIGRDFRASPATGSMKVHVEQQQMIIDKVFSFNKGRK